jgi:hypothetical protein
MIFEHGEVWQISSGKKKPANKSTQYRKLRDHMTQALNNLKGLFHRIIHVYIYEYIVLGQNMKDSAGF